MKIKVLLAALIGALTLQGVDAGTWCPPSPAKGCATDCCPDLGGSISAGYDTDYVFKGVRLARDVVWADVNYTFENLPFSPNVGIWHLSSLGSGTGNFPAGTDSYGDETNLYASIALPSLLGFDTSLGYTYFLFPTGRGPSGTASNGGDSLSQFTFNASREVLGGVIFSYSADYLTGATASSNGFRGGIGGADLELSGWMHTFALDKSICITDCISLDLTAGAYYNDNYYADGINTAITASTASGKGDSGWHAYFLKAALPIALNCRATLTPYVAYNGTPDGWTGDDAYAANWFGGFAASGPIGFDANRNDVFYGGINLSVGF